MHIAPADRWFAALDQRPLGSGASRWVAQVLAVHTERDGLWVQIAPADNPSAIVVLHVSSTTHLDEVLDRLERQNRPEDGPPAVIDMVSGPPILSARYA
jgi:hypothetical protein